MSTLKRELTERCTRGRGRNSNWPLVSRIGSIRRPTPLEMLEGHDQKVGYEPVASA